MKKPPYNLNSNTDLALDQATEIRFLAGETLAHTHSNLLELGSSDYTPIDRLRVLDAAALLFVRYIKFPGHQEQPGRLLAACLDTALIWERG